jgi:lipoprotein-releasing system permease protein
VYKSFLSWRYLVARRTNLIGIAGITVGVGALILILSIMTGFLEETKNTLRGSLADIVIEPSAFDRLGNEEPPKPAPFLEVVRKNEYVESATAHLTWGGILAREGTASVASSAGMSGTLGNGMPIVQLIGIDVEEELASTEFEASLLREPGDKDPRANRIPVEDPQDPFRAPSDVAQDDFLRPWVVVGETVAYQNRLHRGSIINVATISFDSRGNGAQSNREYRVAATFRSGENDADSTRVYMDRDALMDLLGDRLEFSQIVVRLKDYDRDKDAARESIGKDLVGAGLLGPAGLKWEVRTWEDLRQNFLAAVKNERFLMALMLGLVLVVAGFTVFAILSMMVTEKRRDIGTLTALGATPNGIMVMFLMIGFWDALLGASIGATIGTLGALNIDAIERKLSETIGFQIFDRNVYMFDHIPAVVDPLAVVLFVLGAFVCAILFAAIPAWRAARMHPIDALRYE